MRDQRGKAILSRYTARHMLSTAWPTSLMLREFFNVFNVVNFGLPSNIVLGPGFGEISRTAGTSRQIQFSLELIY
jgi:hypothetical protein